MPNAQPSSDQITLSIVKWHVCGNDFVIVDPANAAQWGEPGHLARRLCHRNTGVGADQLLITGKQQTGGQDIWLDIFNPDGSSSPFCGNACLAAAAHTSFQSGGIDACEMWVGDVHYLLTRAGRTWFLEQPEPMHSQPLGDHTTGKSRQYYVRNGTHHRVVLCENGPPADLRREGERLSRIPGMREASNVMFVSLVHQDGFCLTPWERGGTGGSLACGSGASAAAWILHRDGRIGSSVTATCPGGTLHVSFEVEGRVRLGASPVRTFAGHVSREVLHD